MAPRGGKQRGEHPGSVRRGGGITTRLCKSIEAIKGETCILTAFLGDNATDKDYARYMRKILDEGWRVRAKAYKDASDADPGNADLKKLADKYHCADPCVLYFRGTISVDGYCEEGAGEAALPGRLCKYDGRLECLEITRTL